MMASHSQQLIMAFMAWTQVEAILSVPNYPFTYQSLMFTYIKDAVQSATKGNIVVRHGHSDCADYVVANVKDGVAVVKYNNGSIYKYTNVSRRALINLVANTNISLGRWINANLLFNQSKTVQFGTATQML